MRKTKVIEAEINNLQYVSTFFEKYQAKDRPLVLQKLKDLDQQIKQEFDHQKVQDLEEKEADENKIINDEKKRVKPTLKKVIICFCFIIVVVLAGYLGFDILQNTRSSHPHWWTTILTIGGLILWSILSIMITIVNVKTIKILNKFIEQHNQEIEKIISARVGLVSNFISWFNVDDLFWQLTQQILNWDNNSLLIDEQYDSIVKCLQDANNEKIIFAPYFAHSDETVLRDNFVGRIHGSKYYHLNFTHQIMVDEVYHGSTTETYTFVEDGKTEVGTKVITATFVWPKPEYIDESYLICPTKISPKTIFASGSKTHDLRSVDLESDAFNKKCKIITNDENDIRLIFSPLAQEQMLKNRLNNSHVSLIKQEKYFILTNDPHDFLRIFSLTKKMYARKNITLQKLLDQVYANIIVAIDTFMEKVSFLFAIPLAEQELYLDDHSEMYRNKMYGKSNSYQLDKKEFNLPTMLTNLLSMISRYPQYLSLPSVTTYVFDIRDLQSLAFCPDQFFSNQSGQCLLLPIENTTFNAQKKITYVPVDDPDCGIVDVPVEYVDYQKVTNKVDVAVIKLDHPLKYNFNFPDDDFYNDEKKPSLKTLKIKINDKEGLNHFDEEKISKLINLQENNQIVGVVKQDQLVFVYFAEHYAKEWFASKQEVVQEIQQMFSAGSKNA